MRISRSLQLLTACVVIGASCVCCHFAPGRSNTPASIGDVAFVPPQIPKSMRVFAFVAGLDNAQSAWLGGSTGAISVDREAAIQFFDALPVDVNTTVEMVMGRELRSQRIKRGSDAPMEHETLDSRYFVMQRFVIEGGRTFRVVGAHSKAIAQVRNGEVVGHLIRWRRLSAPAVPTVTPMKWEAVSGVVLARITSRFGDRGHLRDAEVVYAENGLSVVPAYAVTVEIDTESSSVKDYDLFYVDAVAGGILQQGPDPAELPMECSISLAATGTNLNVDRFIIGHDNDDTWRLNAARFGAAIAPANVILRHFCRGDRSRFVSNEAAFVDSSDVTLVEAHGAPGEIDIVRAFETVTLGAATRYGDGQDKHTLKLLILHVCEVVASPADDNRWFDRWFEVFQGLHAVVGYRSVALIADDVTPNYAASLAAGKPVISAWMEEIASSDKYVVQIKADGAGGARPAGRGAAVAVCEHENDTLANLTGAADAQCLIVFWHSDQP